MYTRKYYCIYTTILVLAYKITQLYKCYTSLFWYGMHQQRKRARVVEWTGLENQRWGNPSVSSNLTASAKTFLYASSHGGIGRRKRLKISRAIKPVPVRFRVAAPLVIPPSQFLHQTDMFSSSCRHLPFLQLFCL